MIFLCCAFGLGLPRGETDFIPQKYCLRSKKKSHELDSCRSCGNAIGGDDAFNVEIAQWFSVLYVCVDRFSVCFETHVCTTTTFPSVEYFFVGLESEFVLLLTQTFTAHFVFELSFAKMDDFCNTYCLYCIYFNQLCLDSKLWTFIQKS